MRDPQAEQSRSIQAPISQVQRLCSECVEEQVERLCTECEKEEEEEAESFQRKP